MKKNKQYCRYCAYMCCGDANYCEIKNKCFADSTIKTLNHCKYFEFIEVDALDLNHIYKSKKQKSEGEIKLWEE